MSSIDSSIGDFLFVVDTVFLFAPRATNASISFSKTLFRASYSNVTVAIALIFYAQGKYTTFYGKIQYVNVRVFAFNIYVYLCKQFFIIKDFFANIKKRLFDIYQFINKFSNKFTNGYKSRV